MIFQWDPRKERENIARHGVSFAEAQEAFLDHQRILAVDEKHSVDEPRFFCIGRCRRGIVTVRYTRRGNVLRIIGAGYWRKGRKMYEKENG
jgi:hypothetical protein